MTSPSSPDVLAPRGRSDRSQTFIDWIQLNSRWLVIGAVVVLAAGAIWWFMAQKRANEKLALAQKMNPQQTNFNPPAALDPFIYFQDGSSSRGASRWQRVSTQAAALARDLGARSTHLP